MIEDSCSECLPNTRLALLKCITTWATDPSDKRNVFWLHGLAGSGKSTISNTVANFFHGAGHLGAFMFFNPSRMGTCDPVTVIPTLAYQLGSFDQRIGNAIVEVIKSTPSISQSPIHHQFLKLIVEPILSLPRLAADGPIVMVLDALDECGSAKTRRALMLVMVEGSAKLPSFVRIFVTSRPEFDINTVFESQQNILGQELDVSSESNHHDILSYLEHRMVTIREENKLLQLAGDWPGADIIIALG